MYFLQQTQSGGNTMVFLVGLVIVYIIIFYFLLIRPKKLQERKRIEKINNLQVGAEVITNGGITGTISKVDNNFFFIRIAPQVEVKILKSAVTPITESIHN